VAYNPFIWLEILAGVSNADTSAIKVVGTGLSISVFVHEIV
jgi:hypothetical protein